MANAASGIIWTGDLPSNLKKVNSVVQSAIKVGVGVNATKAETWMKSNAPWTDRTSNARNGLTARPVFDSPDQAKIVLSHGVPYGIWLEVRWGGRYAIVGPAVEYWSPITMQFISKLIAARLKKIS